MKLIQLFLLLFVTAANTYGQEYLEIESEGLIHPIATIDRQKSVRIFTVAGMVNFRIAPDLSRTIYAVRSYFKENKSNPGPLLSKGEGKIYLLPNQELLIDVINRETDSLICRYVVKRLKLI
ncbi:MAG: hypothetical protein ACQUHE_14050, partial [Bacteroidia bacterium]